MDYIVKILLTALAVLALSFLPGIEVLDYVTAIWVALAISILNVLVKPILIILSLPITILTLGLFLLVINALIILLVDKLFDGFKVDGFWYALFFSLCISAVHSLIDSKSKK